MKNVIIRCGIAVFILLCSISSFAQTAVQDFSSKNDYPLVKSRVIPSEDIYVQNQIDAQAFVEFELKNKGLKNIPNFGIKLLNENKNKYGTSFHFELSNQGYPVLFASLKLHTDANHKVILFQSASPSFDAFRLDTAPDEKLTEAIMKNTGYSDFIDLGLQWAAVEVEDKVVAHLYRLLEWVDQESAESHHLIVARSGIVSLSAQSMHFHACHEAPPIDTTARGNVFYPDPLTSAEKTYGDGSGDLYTDREDGDFPDLNNELIEVELLTDYQNGLFILENQYLKMENTVGENVPVPTSVDGKFLFTRGQKEFEQVNAFYHCTESYKYVRELGFTDLTQQLLVDARGTTADNSAVTASNGVIRLVLGSGGVDDGEDAEVIWHEFFHFVESLTTPNSWSGLERRAVGEGNADYWATSFTRSIKEFGWERMFTWDGHNPFFAGRWMDTNNHYPEDLVDGNGSSLDQYKVSLIWSSMMIDIWEELGREKTDKLLINATRMNFSMMDMIDAGMNLKASAIQLFGDEGEQGQEDINTVCKHLVRRGLMQFELELGPEVELCLGDTVAIGLPQDCELNAYHDALEVNWAGSQQLLEENSLNPRVVVGGNGEMSVSVRDLFTQATWEDKIFIKAKLCLDTEIPNALGVLNTERFAYGTGQPIFYFPEDAVRSEFQVYDSAGKLCILAEHLGDDFYFPDYSRLTNGVYQIRVTTDEQDPVVFRVLKGGQ